jgi:hypothetical protein
MTVTCFPEQSEEMVPLFLVLTTNTEFFLRSQPAGGLRKKIS